MYARLPRHLLVLALALGLLAASALTPAPALAHDADSNGCGPHELIGIRGVVDRGIPDTPLGLFRFHGPCDQHDRCYGRHPYGTSAAAKRRCDSEFLGRMLAVCYVDWIDVAPPFLGECVRFASLYYGFAKRFASF